MNKTLKKRIFWHDVRKYLREYNEITGIHGLRYLTEKRSKIEKVLWVIIVLVSLGGCIYMVCEIVLKFERSPVVVSFSTRDTPIYEIPFPAVTICPESKCAKAKFDYSEIYTKYLDENKTVTDKELQYFYYMNLLCNDDDLAKVVVDGNKTFTEEFFKVIDALRPEIDMYCYFIDDSYDNDTKCKDILIPIITDVGICYSFNIIERTELFKNHVVHYADFFRAEKSSYNFVGDIGYFENADAYTYPRRAWMSGVDNSLDIYLTSKRDDNDFKCSTFYQGFRVMIHNSMDVPFFSRYFFRVPLNKVVVAAVQPELVLASDSIRAFRPEKRKCYLGSERFLKHFQIYTQSNCLLECLTNYTLKRCGCVRFYMPRNNKTPICGTGSKKCVAEAQHEIKLRELRHKISKKPKISENSCDCKPLCTDLSYNVETSHSDFYWKEFFDANKNINISGKSDNKKWSYSVLSIYFKEEQFITLERHELYGISDLISNFGGLLGLFTGFSLISLAEIIYFLTVRIYYNTRLYGLWSGPSQ